MHPDIAAFAAMRLAGSVHGLGAIRPKRLAADGLVLSCEAMEPQGRAGPVPRAPGTPSGFGHALRAARARGDPSRTEFGLPQDATLYLAPQSLFKMHPDNDALVARILAEDLRAMVVMFGRPTPGSTGTFRARLDAAACRQASHPGGCACSTGSSACGLPAAECGAT